MLVKSLMVYWFTSNGDDGGYKHCVHAKSHNTLRRPMIPIMIGQYDSIK